MKILILSYVMGLGGAERVAATWANGLSAMGHKVAIYSDFSEPQTYDIASTVGIYAATPRKVSSLAGKLRRSVLTFKSLRTAIKDFHPDAVVLVNHAFSPEILLARRTTFPFRIISTEHNCFERPASAPLGRLDRYRKFKLNRRYDAVTVLTYADKAIAEAAGIRNVDVLHNPLFIKPSGSIPQKENTVLAVGRINQWHTKGFDILIEAWRSSAARYPDWKLRIVGSGDSRSLAFMHSLAGDCGSIEFCPFTSDIADEYRRAAIFCLPSRHEGWGLVLAEAMSQHCAVVACDFKGRQTELVTDGVNGLISPSEDAAALAGCIGRLISDPDMCLRFQTVAADNLDQYTPDKVCRQLEGIIKATLR